MADIISGTQRNTGNLIATLGISPTFSGWIVNPGTSDDITNELTNILTTPGVVDGITDAYVSYDFGQSMRVETYINIFSPDYAHMPTEIQASNDNATWYSTTGIEDQMNTLNIAVNARYIRLHLPAFNALNITSLNIRAYLIF
jgi:hypothetical protein